MIDILNALSQKGCDIENTLSRFLDDEEFLAECAMEVLQDENFPKLEEAINNSDVAKAFEYAHTIKGIAGNTGLTPLYDKVCVIVEVLRKGELTNLVQETKELIAIKKDLQALFF